MKWRIIPQEKFSASMNMAIDHMLFSASEPTIRFYKWESGGVSMGALQDQNEINIEACKIKGIGIVRRMTGGSAILHEPYDFTYSVAAPLKNFGGNISEAYREICQGIIAALAGIGINSSMRNSNDVCVGNKKISGNAAKTSKGNYLQHGTIIYDLNSARMSEILKADEAQIRRSVTSVKLNSSASQDDLYNAMIASFSSGRECYTRKLSKEELLAAKKIAEKIYSNPYNENAVKKRGACYVR
ncbi:lipoate--protein ligase family protein [Candidatus Woesearchaeota archaeon]|nr:lipoate--protein ligase family protein [Candidatus Woesearchaeota archaeon]